MLQLENVLLDDICTFVFHQGTEFFDNAKSFTAHRNDIAKIQFWT